MAESVKISELPVRAAAFPDDIVPVVDAAETQTATVTAKQIAELGPADGGVTTAKLANGAVTYAKMQGVAGDKILGRSDSNTGVVQEVTCTPYARTILSSADANAARQALGALASTVAPTFTGPVTVTGDIAITGAATVTGGIAGQVRASEGTNSSPSYSFSSDTNTGLAQLGGGDTLSIVTGGVERLRVTSNGSLLSPITGGTDLLPHYGCRAFAQFHFFGGGLDSSKWGNVTSVSRYNVGHYGVNFTTPMPDALYSLVGTCNANIWSGPGYDDQWILSPKQLYPATATLMTGDNNNEGRWDTYVCVAVFR